MGPGREHNLSGTDLPEAPASGAALRSQHEVVVIEPEGGGAEQDANV